MKKYKLYLLDMDGTIYLGPNLFPQTPPFLQFVKDIGAKYMFLTNNSSSSSKLYAVCVGAYNYDNAKKMQQEMINKGYKDTYLIPR